MISPLGYRPVGLPVMDIEESYPDAVVIISSESMTAPPESPFNAIGTGTCAPLPKAIP